jgi:hypothetical protein
LLLQEKVNQSQIAIIENFMLRNPIISRVNLDSSCQSQIHNNMLENPKDILYQENDLSIVYISPFDKHIGLVGSTHLMPAIWNKEFLLEFIEDKWTWDATERPGCHKFEEQTRQNKNRWKSVATYPSQFILAHLLYTRDPNLVELRWVKEEDKQLVQPYIPSNLKVS